MTNEMKRKDTVKKARQISNKWNWAGIILGILILVLISLIETVCGNKIMNILVVAVAKLIAVLMMIFSVIGLILNHNVNKHLKCLPYAFDYRLELDTYLNIGVEKVKSNIAVKKIKKYTEWKSYIIREYVYLKNNEDFFRFLNRIRRNKKNEKQVWINIVVPVEIAIFTVIYSTRNDMSEMEWLVSVLVLSIIIVVVLTRNILNVSKEIEFIEDYIEIIFAEKYSKRNSLDVGDEEV